MVRASSEEEVRMRVLVVDDEPDIRAMVKMMLGFMEGVELVDEACDGAEAIEAARLLQPDLILLDIDMPVLSGDRALPMLRANAPSATIVVHSAAPASALGEVVDLADGYFQKGRDDVGDFVAELLAGHSCQRAAWAAWVSR
jgi:CheY-like chemotaxis protein